MLALNKLLASSKIAHQVSELWWWNILMSWTLDLWEENWQQVIWVEKLCMPEKHHIVSLDLGFSINKMDTIILQQKTKPTELK